MHRRTSRRRDVGGMRDVPSMTAFDDRARVRSLEAHVAALSPADHPDGWALAAYRLAVALGEDATADRERSLHRSIALLAQAAVLLDPARAPIEHARILNATGAAWRALGVPSKSIDAFGRAASLLRRRARPLEVGTVLSNLGLAHLESGDLAAALRNFDEALALLRDGFGPSADAETRRVFASAALNRAQALLAVPDGDSGGCDGEPWGKGGEAIILVDEALGVSSVEEGPLQVGMLRHTRGLLNMRADQCAMAVDDFTAALAVFTRPSFPFQHAIANFNRGRAKEQLGNFREALLDYESSAQLFDPRLHRPQWLEAASRLADVERRLGLEHPGWTRNDHVVQFLATSDQAARVLVLRERIGRLHNRSVDIQRGELRQLAESALRLPSDQSDIMLRDTIEILMDLPDDILRSAMLAQLDAIETLPEADQRPAHLGFDAAIQQLVMGPQRVRMREILYDAGWERP